MPPLRNSKPQRLAANPDGAVCITFKEYREITMRQIKVNVTTQKATVSQSSPRVDNTPAAQTYTVKKGDCLWNIAKKVLRIRS